MTSTPTTDAPVTANGNERRSELAFEAASRDPRWPKRQQQADAPVTVEQGQTWQHIKRGTAYEVIGVAELQAGQPQYEKAALVIYRGDDGKLWARNTGEFTDGRFRLAALASAPAESEAVAFVRRVSEMVGDELDAHASTELRDAARRVIASAPAGDGVEDDGRDPIADAFIAGAQAVHEEWTRNPGSAPCGDPEFYEAARDYAAALARPRAAVGERSREAGLRYAINEAKRTLSLAQGCLECSADDERRWAETIEWLERLA